MDCIRPQEIPYFTVSGEKKNGKFVHSFDWKERSMTSEDIRLHIRGEKNLGSVPLFASKTQRGVEWFVRWSAIDYDCKESEDPNSISEIDKENIYKIKEQIKLMKMPVALEISRSRGFHFWFFYDQPVLASRAKDLMEHIVEMSGVKDVETFPKQAYKQIGLYKPKTFGSALNMPFCGNFTKINRTVFIDPTKFKPSGFGFKNVEPLPFEQQKVFLSHIKKIPKKTVDELTSKITSSRSPLAIVGYNPKFENGIYLEPDWVGGRERCTFMKKFSDYNDPPGFDDWISACMALAAFEKGHLNGDSDSGPWFVSSQKYPDAVEATEEKIKELQSRGTKGNRCEKTSCPLVGDLNACPYQNIAKAIKKEDGDLDSIDIAKLNVEEDHETLQNNLREFLDNNHAIKKFWYEGTYKTMGDGELKYVTIDPNCGIEERYKATFNMCFNMFNAGLDIDFVYSIIPLFKYGLHEYGNKLSFWRKVNDAYKAYKKHITKYEEKFKETVRNKATYVIVKVGANVGIYEKKIKEIKIDEDGIERKEVEVTHIQITDFVLKYIGKIVSQDGGKNKFIFEYFPKALSGRSIKAIIDEDAIMDNKKMRSSLSQDNRFEANFLIQGESVANIVWTLSQRDVLSPKVFIEINDFGYNDRLNAFFFRDHIIFKGNIINIPSGDKSVRIGNNFAWLSYLDNLEEKYNDIQNPLHHYISDPDKTKEIRDHLMRWFCMTWGGPDNGMDSWLLIGWIVAHIYKKEIMSVYKTFPAFYISGNMGSGKNTVCRIAGQLLGYDNWNEVNFSATTQAGIVRSVVANNIFWLDELKSNRKGGETEELLKAAYTGGTFKKADLKDQDKTKDYIVRASVLVTSQGMPQVEAFLERCIKTDISKEWRVSNPDEAEEAFSMVFDEELGGLNFSELYSKWVILKTNKKAEEINRKIMVYMNEFIKSWKVSDRIAKNYATVIACLECVVYGDYEDKSKLPEFVFGKDRIWAHAEKRSKEINRNSEDPIFPFMQGVIMFFDSSANKIQDRQSYKDYPVLIDLSTKREIMYVNFYQCYIWYLEFLKRLNKQDNIGEEKISDNMQRSKGFLGISKFFNETRNFPVPMMKFEKNSDVFKTLEVIAFTVNKDGSFIPYKKEV